MSSRSSKAQSRASKTVTSTSSSSASSSGSAASDRVIEGNNVVSASSSSEPHVQQVEGRRVALGGATAGTPASAQANSSASIPTTTASGALPFGTPQFPQTSASDDHASDGPGGMSVKRSPLEVRAATTATSTSSAAKGGPRDAASQSEIQFDPDQPLEQGQIMWKQAYDLVRLVRQYTCHHPGILGHMEAVARVRPVVEDEDSPGWVDPPTSDWPVPHVPLNEEWTGSERDACLYRGHVHIYHLVNAAQEILRALLETDDDQPLSCITLHMKNSPELVVVECSEPPGCIFQVDSSSDILDLDPIGSPDHFPGVTPEERRNNWIRDIQERFQRRQSRTLVLLGRLATLSGRSQLTAAEAMLRAKGLSEADLKRLSSFEGLATTLCAQQQELRQAQDKMAEMADQHRELVAKLTASHSERIRALQIGAQERERDAAASASILHEELRRSMEALTQQHVEDIARLAAQGSECDSKLMEARARLEGERIAREHYEQAFNVARSDCEELRRQLAVQAAPGIHRSRTTSLDPSALASLRTPGVQAHGVPFREGAPDASAGGLTTSTSATTVLAGPRYDREVRSGVLAATTRSVALQSRLIRSPIVPLKRVLPLSPLSDLICWARQETPASRDHRQELTVALRECRLLVLNPVRWPHGLWWRRQARWLL